VLGVEVCNGIDYGGSSFTKKAASRGKEEFKRCRASRAGGEVVEGLQVGQGVCRATLQTKNMQPQVGALPGER